MVVEKTNSLSDMPQKPLLKKIINRNHHTLEDTNSQRKNLVTDLLLKISPLIEVNKLIIYCHFPVIKTRVNTSSHFYSGICR